MAQEGARKGMEPRPHVSTLRNATLTIREDSATGGRAVGALEGLAVLVGAFHIQVLPSAVPARRTGALRVPLHPLGRDKGLSRGSPYPHLA